MKPVELETRLQSSFFRSMDGLRRYGTATLEYFESLIEHDPEYAQWQRGAQLTTRWMGLFDMRSATQQDVDSLFVAMRVESNPGTQYVDLYRRLQDWGRAMGFQVPDDFPWH